MSEESDSDEACAPCVLTSPSSGSRDARGHAATPILSPVSDDVAESDSDAYANIESEVSDIDTHELPPVQADVHTPGA